MSRRKNRKQRADLKGQLLLGLGVVLLTLFGFFYYELSKSIVERDPVSLCREDGLISVETAIVIDATDSFSKTQALLVKKELERLLEQSRLDERFTLYVLGEQFEDGPDRLSVCNPGDGSDKSELTANKRRLREKWEDKFYLRVVSEIDKLVGEHSAQSSPILEMLKLVSVKTMYDSSAEEKRVVMVSDMLHHTSQYSHYKIQPNFEAFSGSPYALEQRPHLSDVDVIILYLVRAKNMNRQNRGHIAFWESLVASGGGMVTRVKTVN